MKYILLCLSLIITAQAYSQIETIGVGTSANDRTGDPLRTAFTKVNTNFAYVAAQLGAKATIASPTFTGTVVLPSTTSIGTVSNTEISYIDGLTSSVQTQLDGKQNLLTNSAGLASALSDESGTGTVAFTSYVDGKIDDGTITDGATTTAPSEDDVFDALALKAERTREYGLACSDLTTALTTGTSKAYFRVPRGFTVTAVRASLLTAQTAGSILTIDINEGGTTILSTKLTIDNSEKTSTTAATAAVISDSSLADDAEITIDIDQVGTSPAGLIVWIIGY
jgi:hypothetical protein